MGIFVLVAVVALVTLRLRLRRDAAGVVMLGTDVAAVSISGMDVVAAAVNARTAGDAVSTKKGMLESKEQ